MIAAADRKLNVSACHAVENRRVVAAQFTAVTRPRAAACNLSVVCYRNVSSVSTSNIDGSMFALHPYCRPSRLSANGMNHAFAFPAEPGPHSTDHGGMGG